MIQRDSSTLWQVETRATVLLDNRRFETIPLLFSSGDASPYLNYGRGLHIAVLVMRLIVAESQLYVSALSHPFDKLWLKR